MNRPSDLHVGVVITDILKTPRALRARAGVVAAASLAVVAGSLVLAAPSQASDPAATAKTITGSHPSWATASSDAGAVPAAAEITGTVYLAGQDAAGLTRYATEVSDPASASYGKFLSPAAYKARFGATAAQVSAVQKWAKDSGLSVVSTTDHAVQVRGTNAAITKAFGTGVRNYRVQGKLMHAPSRDVVVPASVSRAILGVTGLTSAGTNIAKPDSVKVSNSADPSGATAKGAKAATVSPSSGLPTVATCSDYWGQKLATGAPAGYTNKAVPFDQCSFYPSQLRKAYGVTASGLTGKGATVAIVDAYGSSTMQADANQYATNHGDKAFKPGQYREVVDPTQWTNQDLCGGPEGWAPEEALDVEMAHGLAPDASVVYVGANSCDDTDLLAALTTIVDNHLADVVSNSWGEIMHTTDGADVDRVGDRRLRAGLQAGRGRGHRHRLLRRRLRRQQPAGRGHRCELPGRHLARAGRLARLRPVGDLGRRHRARHRQQERLVRLRDRHGHPALQPVGGRHQLDPGAPAPFYFGGGGGTSEDFAQPWYQRGVVPQSASHTLMTGARSRTAQRVTPDISMNGDLYTSVLVGISDGGAYSEGGYGGTSVSSPEFAAVQADVKQALHHAVGFANPSIYARSNLLTDVVDRQAQRSNTPLSSVADFGLVNGTLAARLVAFGQDTSLNAVRGYDDATGVGSPNLSYFRSFR